MYTVRELHCRPTYRKGDLEAEEVVINVTTFKTRTEAKNYIENKLRGKKDSWRDYHKGNKNPSYNKKLTEEDRKNRRRIEGYGKWRKQVFQRDNYTCQISGQTDVEIIAHHLNGYDWDKEHRTDINNGITLSKKIHDLFHKQYGYGDNTKEQFEEFKQRYYNGEFN